MIQASIKVHKYQTKNLVEKIFFNLKRSFISSNIFWLDKGSV